MNPRTITGLVALLMLASPLAALGVSADDDENPDHTTSYVANSALSCALSTAEDCPENGEALVAAVEWDLLALQGMVYTGDGRLAVFGDTPGPLPPQAVVGDHTLVASLTVNGNDYTAGSVRFLLTPVGSEVPLTADATHVADGVWTATFPFDDLSAAIGPGALVHVAAVFADEQSRHNAASQILAEADPALADAVEDMLSTPVLFADLSAGNVFKEKQEPIPLELEGTTGGDAIPSPFADGSFVPQDLTLHDGSTWLGFYSPFYYVDVQGEQDQYSDMDQDGDSDLAELVTCGSNSNPFSSASTCDNPTAAGDGDEDDDGVPDETDNCPDDINPDQADLDGDGIGDACDGDRDGDGVADGSDACPDDDRGSKDTDGDFDCDEWDTDDDNDGVLDGADNCPTTANTDQNDMDDDGTGDVCDDNADGDLLPAGVDPEDGDADEPIPQNLVPTSPLAEGCNASDPVAFVTGGGTDECYQDPEPESLVGQVIAFVESRVGPIDVDEDGVPDAVDNCGEDANPDQADSDLDGAGDACDDENAPLLPVCDPVLENVCVKKVPEQGDVPEDPRDAFWWFLPDCGDTEQASKPICYRKGGITGLAIRILDIFIGL